MLDSVISNASKKTQTGWSAFFSARGDVVARTANRVKRILVAFLLMSILGSPARAFEAAKPAVHLKGVSVEGIDWNNRSAKTTLSIAIDNPGPAFKLRDLSYRLKLNDAQAAEGRYDPPIEVPAQATATFELPCNVDLSALPGVAWAIITGGFDVHYELETEFTVPLVMLNPRIKTSVGGDLSLVETVGGWTARIKESLSSQP